MADAALEVWSDLAPMAELRAALPAALQLGRLGRVESWVRCQPSMCDERAGGVGTGGGHWLGTLVLDPPVGSVTDPGQQ